MRFSPKAKLFLLRALLGASILLACIGGAVALIRTRPKAQTQAPTEPELTVSLQPATHRSLLVRLEGFGVARPLRSVQIAPEVGGRVVEMPRLLNAGDRVAEAELLFQIDPADYDTAVAEASAAVGRLRASLAQLDIQEKSERERLTLLARSRDLARAEFERVGELFRSQQIGSATAVEGAEQAFNQASNTLLLSEQTLALLPERRKELENEFRASETRLERAVRNRGRTAVKAPFAGRIVASAVEIGHIAQAGMPLLTLVDDSVLEIEVALTAADLRQWIPFAENTEAENAGFPPLSPLAVEVEWSDGAALQTWQGRMDRVVSFDAATRSAMVAVRVEGPSLRSGGGRLPLADGMFCRVLLPGKQLEQVVALPRGAVTFDGNVYLSVAGRLKTQAVDVRRSEGQEVYVTGLREGDLVVVTRVVAPLEGVKLIPAE